MALTHLVDTSVLTRLGQQPIRAAVELRAARGELARAGIRDLEIGYSTRSAGPDLLIAAAAEANNLIVLHYDADFDRIAAITGQACQWIVPRRQRRLSPLSESSVVRS